MSSRPLRGVPPARHRVETHQSTHARSVVAVDLFDRLTDGGRAPGSVLLESGDFGGPRGHRSLLFPDPLLRVTYADGTLCVRALTPRATPLLDELLGEEAPFPGHRESDDTVLVDVPATATDPALPDRERIRSKSVFTALRHLTTRLGGGNAVAPPVLLAGAFSHDLVDHFEVLPPRPPGSADPDLCLMLNADGIVVDHAAGRTSLITRALAGPGVDEAREVADASRRLERYEAALSATPGTVEARETTVEPPSLPATAEMTGGEFRDGVRSLLDHVGRGDIFQGVLSRTLTVASRAGSLDVYRRLVARNPSPYMFHCDLPDGSLLGASPECCVRVEDGIVHVTPIAGTAPRGRAADGSIDPEIDTRNAVGLMLDGKEQAEHAMLVDLARNDVARIARPGSRRVTAPFSIERFSHVQHLASTVTGELDDGLDALDAYRACANMGTLTGAPKLRAMELIRELEPTARGFYGGAVGYLTAAGDLDSCIVIRSLRHRDGAYSVRAGAGIVADSRPDRELAETLHKAHAPLLAVALADEARHD